MWKTDLKPGEVLTIDGETFIIIEDAVKRSRVLVDDPARTCTLGWAPKPPSVPASQSWAIDLKRGEALVINGKAIVIIDKATQDTRLTLFSRGRQYAFTRAPWSPPRT